MTGKILRLVNFLIDTTIYFVFITCFILIFKNKIEQENIKWISILFYFLYYFLFEYIKGQTIGKLVTRSKVKSLSSDNKYFIVQILTRTILRFLPLDMLTYIFSFRGLHDWISKTTVIKL